jgi:hypothetical protein
VSWHSPNLAFPHFLGRRADYPNGIGRQVLEVVEVPAIEHATWDVLGRIGNDHGQVGVQRREDFFEMVSAPVEVIRIGAGIDSVGDIPGEGSDTFRVCLSHRRCGLRRPSARHQLANCRSNALSLSHGYSPWFGLGPVASLRLAAGLHKIKVDNLRRNFDLI